MNNILLTFALFLSIQSASADVDRDEILKILDEIVSGWEQADGAPFRQHFLDFKGARYIESGGQNIGLTELIEDHVEPEGHSIKLDLNFTNPVVHIDGTFAWVIVDIEVLGTIIQSGKGIHNKGFETIIFRKIDQEWKVVHTHSSSRPVKVK